MAGSSSCRCHVPESLLVIGGGYVAMEQAQLFSRLGAHVTTLVVLSAGLPRWEPEAATALEAPSPTQAARSSAARCATRSCAAGSRSSRGLGRGGDDSLTRWGVSRVADRPVAGSPAAIAVLTRWPDSARIGTLRDARA